MNQIFLNQEMACQSIVRVFFGGRAVCCVNVKVPHLKRSIKVSSLSEIFRYLKKMFQIKVVRCKERR